MRETFRLADSSDLPQNNGLRVRTTMAVKIEVQPAGENQFRVRLTEGKSETGHVVTVTPEDYRRLTGGKVDPSELVRRSFEFLLENEPKESILQKFDLSVIGRYFPEYVTAITRRLEETD
jgi:hypothetical protein